MYLLIQGYLERLPGAVKEEQLADGSTVRRSIYTPHSLRATTATLLLDANVDIVKVKDLLGHRHITTTQIYDKRRRFDLRERQPSAGNLKLVALFQPIRSDPLPAPRTHGSLFDAGEVLRRKITNNLVLWPLLISTAPELGLTVGFVLVSEQISLRLAIFRLSRLIKAVVGHFALVDGARC